MKLYNKNEKPFVYSAFSELDRFSAEVILQKISEEGIPFWHSEQFSKREIKRIEAAFSCIVFISNNAATDGKVRRCIEYAVKYNKKILCIYLEHTSLGLGLELLLNSLQSINKINFSNENDFFEKLKSAEAFSNMEITITQKKFAKRRALASVLIPIAAAVFVFFTIIVPLLIIPTIKAASGSLSKVGFGELSLAELAKVEELRVVGTQSYDQDYFASYIDDKKQEVVGHLGIKSAGKINDISDLALLKSAKYIAFEANQISDPTPIFKIKTLESLTLNCNPIKSIDGIEELQNLRDVNLAYTEINDISPLFKIPSLNSISISNTYVNSIDGIGNLPYIMSLRIDFSNITDISPLNEIDFSYINDSDGFCFSAEGLHIKDYYPLQRIPKFNLIGVTVRRLDSILPHISNKKISELCIIDSNIKTIRSLDLIQDIQTLVLLNSYQLTSIEGIEDHNSLTDIRIVNCPNITDYTPLFLLPKLERLTMTSDMKDVASIQLEGAKFEIIYEDEQQ